MGWDNSAEEPAPAWDTKAIAKEDNWDSSGEKKSRDPAGPAFGDAGSGDARLHQPKFNFDDFHGNGMKDGGDETCRNCGGTGHFARECPEPRKLSGNCFNCDQPGHNKADCPNPRAARPFTGTCRICQKEGHAASECPDKPPDVCQNCKQEGHKAVDCQGKRFLDRSKVAEKDAEAAWMDVVKADNARELDDLREAIQVYVKAVPESTYDQLELAFRTGEFRTYIIAIEQDATPGFTLVDLQGKIDCKYTVGYFFKPTAPRASLREGWPSDPEDNIERLKDAGIPMTNAIPKCNNCNEYGHISKECKEERVPVVSHNEIKCVICDESGHRARDCVQTRRDPFACRNCKQSGHTAAECTEPRSAEGVECKKCNEMGHFAKDCPTGGSQTCRNCGQEGYMSKDCDQPKNPATVTCRNCEQMGHFSRDCPEAKDWSKVKCNNCGEMGHTIKRCKMPISTDEDGGDAGFGGAGNGGAGLGDSGDGGGITKPAGYWESAPAAPSGPSGGWEAPEEESAAAW